MILVDTNVLVALLIDRDDNHDAASQWVAATTDELMVTPMVVAEVCYLAGERARNRTAEAAFLRSIAAAELSLCELTSADLARMADLVEHYASLGLGGTDASVIAVAERLGIERVATFDRRHFNVVQPSHVEAFTLLP